MGKAKNKEELSIVVVGHVDHGKSTLIGRLLSDTKSLPKGAIDKVHKMSEEKGKKFEYAYLLDAFEEEQKQGITIDITRLRFSTEKRDYIIIDAPGHKEFLKNMVSGAAAADVAFLLIDANEGIQEQSKRHCYILSLLGIKTVYVIVNKMDIVDYSKERFEEVRDEFNVFLSNLNIYPKDYIPVSAYYGDNLTETSDKMTWYKGKSIVQVMDSLSIPSVRNEKPLRLPIQDVYKFDSRRIIAGRIESGSINKGDEVTIYPSGKKTRVKSLEYFVDKDKKDSAYSGESVGITFEDEFFNKRGEVITKGDAPKISNLICGNIFWLAKEPLIKGKEYKLKIQTQEVICTIVSIAKVIDSASLKGSKSDKVQKNEVCEVTIKTKSPICFDEFSDIEQTGRFVIVDNYNISGGGIITKQEESLQRDLGNINVQDVNVIRRIITRSDRENSKGQRGRVVWLTGKSGCGKNEIALKLEKKLFDLKRDVYYLNSSNLRYGISSNLGFKDEDVHEHIRRVAHIANTLADAGIITIVTSVSRHKDDRKNARNIIGEESYNEIFIDAPDNICRVRNEIFNNKECNYEYEKADYPVISLFIDKTDFNSEKRA
ncbi:MAG: GTP-binding protein, partial [Clostridium sp.]|uniref:GTP-binding protein n=1 Tax=Clostridium sp. TaxID=1506 RepID=UPI002FCC76D0